MIVVSDTSPITALLSIQRIEILKTLYGEVRIPLAVESELRRHHAKIPAFIRAEEARDAATVRVLEARLDKGEAEAIVLAKELRADFLLMDEVLGRTVAREQGVRVIGLVGILLVAKERGTVQSLGEIFSQLEREASFYLSKALKERALKEAGEL